METFEKRKHKRIDSINLLSYVCVDEGDNSLSQGVGRTLNISEGGIFLETHIPVESQYVVLMSIGLEDEVIDIKGKVIYSKENKASRFESGIEFLEISDKDIEILKKYIKVFKEQKNISN